MRRSWIIWAALLVMAATACGPAGTLPPLEPTQTEALAPASPPESQPPQPAETLPPPTASEKEPAAITPSAPLGPAIPPLRPGEAVEIQFIAMIDTDRGWAIGGEAAGWDHILRTEDSGTRWIDVTPPEPTPATGGLRAVAIFRDISTAWVLYYPDWLEPQYGASLPVRVWRTADGGATWEVGLGPEVEFLGKQDSPPYFEATDSGHGWILARFGGVGMHRYPVYLLRSQDGGGGWAVSVDPYQDASIQGCRKSGMAVDGAGHVLLTVDNCPVSGAMVYLSEDGGGAWTEVQLPAPPGGEGWYPDSYCEGRSPQFLAAGFVRLGARCRALAGDALEEYGLLYESRDGGRTWLALPYPGGDLLFLDGDNGFALGLDIYFTADGGRTWEKRKSVAWEGQFSFVDPENGWAVARAEDEIALVQTQDGGRTWSMLEPIVAGE